MIRIFIWKIILACTIFGIAAKFDNFRTHYNPRYDNYKLFEITPKTQKQLMALSNLENVDGFFFWQRPTSLDEDVTLLVNPNNLPEYYSLTSDMDVSYQTLHDNVQEWIDMYNTHKTGRSKTFSYHKYHTLDEIYKELDNLAIEHPSKVQTIIGGRTYEGRQIKGVKVSFKANNPGIFIEGGIHSHQWMSPATTMYILHELLTSNDADVRELAERHDWYIFPVFNPDGYEFTHTSAFNRYWPKTRKPYNGSCVGANLNMNWDYKWNTGGTRSDPCSPDYPGNAPFSEIEAKSMSEYIKTISDKFYAYISISGNQRYLLFPYGYTTEHVENYNELIGIARKTREAIKRKYGTRILVGGIAETYGTISGCTVDYIQGVHGTHLVFMYQLHHRRGFDLPPEEILPMGKKTLDTLVAMFKEVEAQGDKKVKS